MFAHLFVALLPARESRAERRAKLGGMCGPEWAFFNKRRKVSDDLSAHRGAFGQGIVYNGYMDAWRAPQKLGLILVSDRSQHRLPLPMASTFVGRPGGPPDPWLPHSPRMTTGHGVRKAAPGHDPVLPGVQTGEQSNFSGAGQRLRIVTFRLRKRCLCPLSTRIRKFWPAGWQIFFGVFGGFIANFAASITDMGKSDLVYKCGGFCMQPFAFSGFPPL